MIEVEAVITKLTANKDGVQISMDVMAESLDAISDLLNKTIAVKIEPQQAGLFDKNGKQDKAADE